MDQVLEVAGALLILLALFALQRGWLTPQSPAYVLLNLGGSAVLTVIATLDDDWGFVLLQGTWAIVSAWALILLSLGQAQSARGSRRSH
jgi:hypothetical protein